VQHDFTFTPAMSLYVHCDTEDEIGHLFAALSENGKILMPLGAYDFSPKFRWVADRFGVAWQFTLAGSGVPDTR
jgi:predicted 3-demethylubiquinone-9 3-methyltransferase (glyoxalase superfamily)